MLTKGEPHLSVSLIRRTDRYADFPLEALEAVALARRCLDEIEDRAIAVARSKGATWEEIAESLGVSRQAVYQRYRSHHKDR